MFDFGHENSLEKIKRYGHSFTQEKKSTCWPVVQVDRFVEHHAGRADGQYRYQYCLDFAPRYL